jgi:hypothetical protein
MNSGKEARNDAREFARAQMYYGEGAGTRRKLIEASVESKATRDPEYARAFRQELQRQDMAEHAEAARKERRRRDNAEAVKQNTKALVTGNYQNAQSTVLILVVAAYVVHQTGLDQKVYQKGKELASDLKAKWRRRRHLKVVIIDQDGRPVK